MKEVFLNLTFSSVIEVVPQSGNLSPGDHIICRINFLAKRPQIFQFDLPCMVINLTEKQKRDAIDDANSEEQAEFLITDDGHIQTITVCSSNKIYSLTSFNRKLV